MAAHGGVVSGTPGSPGATGGRLRGTIRAACQAESTVRDDDVRPAGPPNVTEVMLRRVPGLWVARVCEAGVREADPW